MRPFWKIAPLTPERRQDVREEIADISTPSRSFYVLVAISATIAAYGLLANSTAVVIGAMLVAPLMGPIFGIALAIATGDRRLLARAAASEVVGVLVAIGLAALIGLIPLRLEFGSEIAARVQPTIYDIIIAVASGLAGAYAIINERVNSALPGVAVAVAVVPPLATCGVCIAVGSWGQAWGAFLLFGANFLAIEIAAALVFTVFGMAPPDPDGTPGFARFLRRFSVSLLALGVVAVVMTRALWGLIGESRFSSALEQTMAREVGATVGARVSDVSHDRSDDGTIQVRGVVLTPQALEPPQVARLETALRRDVDTDIRLVVRSILSKDYGPNGPVFIAEEELQRREQQAEEQQRRAAEAELLTQAGEALSRHLQQIPGAQLADIRRQRQADVDVITAEVRTPTAIEPAQVAECEQALQETTQTDARLVVRSVLTRDADAQRYLYEPEEEPKVLVGTALKVHVRLEEALSNQLALAIPGARLLEFRYTQQDERLPVLAVVRAPRTFEPEQVLAIEAQLRRHVDARIDLVVRSQVGADTGPLGYVGDLDEETLTPQQPPEPATPAGPG